MLRKVPKEMVERATVHSSEEAVSTAREMGIFPIMIKASQGGGGKGLRRATSCAASPLRPLVCRIRLSPRPPVPQA